ncbi:unnamed protein product [Lepeophtheirus salmonis]|uniref:(salmon louse) hypothetical protein n=1 Tax=Lepeophtheirus salmonis TaxID=72036 RepID=A0A7R8H352_LEPSM|nr:unnamed protein product [Lepeophtheirus salmonis]CAF2840838.1 unnamed protein product [Lepeophtheirus salmonis]
MRCAAIIQGVGLRTVVYRHNILGQKSKVSLFSVKKFCVEFYHYCCPGYLRSQKDLSFPIESLHRTIKSFHASNKYNMRTITLSLLCISTILSISQTVSAFDHETSPTKRFPTLPFPYSNDRKISPRS